MFAFEVKVNNRLLPRVGKYSDRKLNYSLNHFREK